MQALTTAQKNALNQSIPALGPAGSGISAADIIDSLFLLGGKIVTATFNATPGTALSVTHSLGYVPRGYISLNRSIAGNTYDGGAAWTATTISLKDSGISTVATFLVF
jgi:hypothetical protein